jgi:hypothetical protein
MLAFMALGGALVAVPRRVVGVLADGFGFAPDFTAHGGVKKVVARLAGAGLIIFGVYLGVNTLALAGAFAHWH